MYPSKKQVTHAQPHPAAAAAEAEHSVPVAISVDVRILPTVQMVVKKLATVYYFVLFVSKNKKL